MLSKYKILSISLTVLLRIFQSQYKEKKSWKTLYPDWEKFFKNSTALNLNCTVARLLQTSWKN